MKLLDKQAIAVAKTSERKRDVDEGIKLAESIDALRRTHAQEQVSLKKFRDETLKNIKSEIELYTKERDEIKNDPELISRENMHKKVLHDIREERKILEEDKKSNKELKDLLLSKESELSLREIIVQSETEGIFEREIKLQEKEKEADKIFSEAQRELDNIQIIKRESEDAKRSIDKKQEESSRDIKNKIEELKYIEHDLNLKLEQIEKDKAAITQEQIHIASQQETLKSAWDLIKKLKNK